MGQINGSIIALEPLTPLPPTKARWIIKENENWQKELQTDIAMLLNSPKKNLDLVEVFCSPTSQLTKSAQNANLDVERWTRTDFDLSTPSGCQKALDRLREVRPERLWLSPECGPYSIIQNANQQTPNQKKELENKRKLAYRMWQSCIRLAWLQVELGGKFYIEQPERCMTWRRSDMNTQHLLDELSTKCIRDQCVGLVHPKSGLPMQKGTRIQTNDLSFAREFAQRCTGHDYAHVPISGGNIAANTAFYPKKKSVRGQYSYGRLAMQQLRNASSRSVKKQ